MAQRPPQQRPPQQRPVGYPPQQRPMGNPNMGNQRPPQQTVINGQPVGGQRPMNPQQARQQRPMGNPGDPNFNGQRPMNPQQARQQRPQPAPQNRFDDDDDDFGINVGMDEETKGKRGRKPRKPKEGMDEPRTPVYDGDGYQPSENDVTIKDWLFFMLKMLIPIYNIIVFVKTAIGGPNIKPSMTSYVRFSLIMIAVSVVITILFSVVLGGLLASIF